MKPGILNITAYRWQPFVQTIQFENLDFTGAVFKMEVRLYKDALHSPLITLTNAAPPAQGISVETLVVEGMTISNVTIRIDRETIDATEPFTGSNRGVGADAKVKYDLHITPPGELERRWLEGEFIVAAGVTR